MSRWIAKSWMAVVAASLSLVIVSDASAQTLLRGTKPKYPVRSQPSARYAVKRTAVTSPTKSTKRSPAVSRVQSPAGFAEGLAIQSALDRAGFSPGVIDGMVGPKTVAGLRAFQQANGLPVTGTLDRETRLALGVDAAPPTLPYRLTDEDGSQVGDCPTDWIAKSKKKKLGFESLLTVAAHHGHCSRRTVERLNVGKNLTALKVGDMVVIPNVEAKPKSATAARVEIDFATKNVRAYDAADKLLGLFHCSIAKEAGQRPGGVCKVAAVSQNPNYTFKPEGWPEVKGIDRPLQIPPGPRNPVGLCWIGLDKKGYGIHGTPEPELIGKTGSHGCIRLTNWDVLRLAGMVSVGTEVKFVDSGAGTFARSH
ncbi:MAG TPA: L,D-transpeptidase [Phycisphaerae bacterium]|nr:L,D-transpeptidase [Phycisphaerae bacterium]